jgi:hypothetical protein
MSNPYPNSGALFTNDRRTTDKAPSHQGDISFEVALLKQLIAESDGEDVKIKISGWEKEGRNGTFISLKYNDFKPTPQGESYTKPPKPNARTSSAMNYDDSDVPF